MFSNCRGAAYAQMFNSKQILIGDSLVPDWDAQQLSFTWSQNVRMFLDQQQSKVLGSRLLWHNVISTEGTSVGYVRSRPDFNELSWHHQRSLHTL